MLGLKWLRDDEGEGEKGHLRFEEEVWEKKPETKPPVWRVRM